MMIKRILLFCFFSSFAWGLSAQELEEFKTKRKDVFEFTQAPKMQKEGDTITISFAVKDYCDVTVVIENSDGKIRRHLASGVLGANAPEPFAKNSLSQSVIWDSKDDEGVYIDDLGNHKIRVSLGLKPMLEKRLFYTPYKRMANIAPLLAVNEAGVYTFEGLGSEFVKLFDHKGNYVRTIYPFPANKVKDVKGLKYFKSYVDGKMYPEKHGYNQATLLTSGTSSGGDSGNHYGGYAATAMAVRGKDIALAFERLNRLGTDGTSNGRDFNGPKVSVDRKASGRIVPVGPTSIALSPDSKYLYLTGYVFKVGYWEYLGDCYQVVFRMEYNKNEPPTIFKGKMGSDDAAGSDNESFSFPSSVDVDNKGRVYISDFGNDRIQVYAEDGKHLKTIKALLPTRVAINPKTQDILVYSGKVIGASSALQKKRELNISKMKNTVVNLGTFENPKEGKVEELPMQAADGSGASDNGGQSLQVIYDSYADKETIWSVGRKATVTSAEFRWSGAGEGMLAGWAGRGIRLYQKEKDKWVEIDNFAVKAQKEVVRVDPPPFGSQRLMFNPSDGNLYVGEDVGFWKSFDELVRINPESGEISLQPIPFDAAAVVFWYHDIVYLRAEKVILRYNSRTWKEIPWDYGIEKSKIFFQTFGAPRRSADSPSALAVPGVKPVHWQLGALNVNAKGNLAMVGYAPKVKVIDSNGRTKQEYKDSMNTEVAYKLNEYPGRGGYYFINIWDQYGNMIKEDCLPGMPYTDSVGLDVNNDLYVLLGGVRYLGKDKEFKEFTETIVKVKPNKSRLITNSSKAVIPLPKTQTPERSPDMVVGNLGGDSWIENPEWMYGGVSHGAQSGCACWHGEFTLDYLGRTFVPEPQHYQVAILDSAGNLIMRVGQYANAESYGANSPVPLGGNEIGLMLAHYVAVDTDKRLFIADTGNERILSVKLNYEVNVELPLRDK